MLHHNGHCEENPHVERSHRTDDDEFYIPCVAHIHSDQDLLDEALGYLHYYKDVREHSSLGYQLPSLTSGSSCQTSTTASPPSYL
ncbi:MAG: transposase [Anaerolineales bacterium]|nr:MAG: transposase [Anaerolineales bacterium]